MQTIPVLPTGAAELITPRCRLTLDRSGPWPTLCLARPGVAAPIALNGRRNPVLDAERRLQAMLRGRRPATIVVLGLGLGYMLDALEREGDAIRVLAFEPFPEAIPHFHARRDWSAWLDTGRLHIVEGPEYRDAAEAWAALSPTEVPPVVVNPVLQHACPELVAAARGAITRARFGSRFDSRLTTVRQSMLHEHVLTFLEHAAATSIGAIVEIGAYVGGGTIAMTTGIRDSGRDTLMITIEPGGAYPTHPHLPSQDIFSDLWANLRARGLLPYVTLLRGTSSDPQIVETVRARLAERDLTIGLLCIDADGQVQRDFDRYPPMCAPGCTLVIDDYTGPPENTKTDPTRAAVDALVAAGHARELGVCGWGTWIGVWTGPPFASSTGTR